MSLRSVKQVLCTLVVATGLAWATVPGQAAVYYTSQADWLADNPGAWTLGFNGVAPDGGFTPLGGSFSHGGVTFTGSRLAIVASDFWPGILGGSVGNAPRDHLIDDSYGTSGFIRAAFAGVDSLGFMFSQGFPGSPDAPVSISLFSDSTLLARTEATGGTLDDFRFFGVSDLGQKITSFVLEPRGIQFLSITSLSFANVQSTPPGTNRPAAAPTLMSYIDPTPNEVAVPEPASVALLGMALLAMALLLPQRRRRRSVLLCRLG